MICVYKTIMQNSKRIALKRLKRKRKLEGRRKYITSLKRGGFIIWGNGNMTRTKPPKPKKPKVKKEMKTYKAVKLTAKLDAITEQIRRMDPSDPKLAQLKERREKLKVKLANK